VPKILQVAKNTHLSATKIFTAEIIAITIFEPNVIPPDKNRHFPAKSDF
jgi:hypothetical protein